MKDCIKMIGYKLLCVNTFCCNPSKTNSWTSVHWTLTYE